MKPKDIAKERNQTGVDWRFIRDYPATVRAIRYNRFARGIKNAKRAEAGK